MPRNQPEVLMAVNIYLVNAEYVAFVEQLL